MKLFQHRFQRDQALRVGAGQGPGMKEKFVKSPGQFCDRGVDLGGVHLKGAIYAP